MNNTVDFELSKLLKKKGFQESIRTAWYIDEVGYWTYPQNHNKSNVKISAPTIAEIVMWIYEKHKIWISVDMVFEESQTGFWYCIRESKEDDIPVESKEYASPTEAYTEAITYVLNNLL